MKASLRTLLAGIVDYAGTFPPARLSLEETVRRFVEYRQGQHAWMLGKLVCSVDQLPAAIALLDPVLQGDSNATVALSLLVSSNDEEHLARVNSVLFSREAEVFFQRHGKRATIDSLELKLGQDVECFVLTTPMRHAQIPTFVELSADDEWDRNSRRLFDAFRDSFPPSTPGKTRLVGFKLRTGGLEAEAFPSVERVAWVIAKCRDGRIPWKATAGLHHPLPHCDEEIGVTMHGLLNVACAATLAEVHRLDAKAIAEILRDASIESFDFGEAGLRWRNLEATCEQIAAARQTGFQSFGSCSFHEPIEGLAALGLL